MKTPRHEHYTYRVTWSEEDGEYVGLCAEFASVSWLAKTPRGAFSGIRTLVRGILRQMQAAGEPIPRPLSLRDYSGKFIVRVTPQLHRLLALQAAEADISLNRLVCSRLAH